MSGYADEREKDSANNHTVHGPNSPILVTNNFAYKVSNSAVNPIRGDAVAKGRKATISTTDRKLIWNILINWIYSGTNETETRAE